MEFTGTDRIEHLLVKARWLRHIYPELQDTYSSVKAWRHHNVHAPRIVEILDEAETKINQAMHPDLHLPKYIKTLIEIDYIHKFWAKYALYGHLQESTIKIEAQRLIKLLDECLLDDRHLRYFRICMQGLHHDMSYAYENASVLVNDWHTERRWNWRGVVNNLIKTTFKSIAGVNGVTLDHILI